ncbi:MAG TPA: serine/threonine-protein kinase, partial [Blastocatellia bacterium]|nr:serine/threonine-protein kinase [Blastocatellia bacterium]
MGSRQIGNYRIVDYVGSGGFGSVFKAEDVNSPGRFVAIKELHKKHTRSAVIKQRFFQEALAMARLDHPNLPRLYTFGEDNGSYYLVMEFVSGSPLGEEIARGSIVPDRAVAIISQVLEAVGYAHKNGVIHRDLKPDNILLTGDGDSLTVKVLDFGIAKLVGGENLTLTGEGFGTPSYMSPERIIGNAELDCRTDIYSLGIILCEMLTGNVPFQSSSTDPVLYWAEMRRMHESQPIPDVAPLGIPAGLDAVIKKAAAKRIQDRYATAEEMLAAISGQPTSAGLHLTTAPFSAEVFVDNVCRGISDEVKGRISIEGLTPGLHSVRVSKRGYSPYKIDVSLAPGQSIELQVQLPALSTVAIPRFETAEPGDVSTNRIQSGDEAKTALLTFENLPAGSTVSFEGAVVAAAGADGRATMALGAGTHELEFTPPSGTAEKRLVTVAGQDVGSVKTIAISPAATRQTNNAPMRVEQRQEPVVAIGLDKSKRTKKVAAASASVVIFASLVAAAFFVMRGPGKAPAHAAAVSQSPVATVSTET